MTQDIPTPTEVKARAQNRALQRHSLEREILALSRHLGTDQKNEAVKCINELNERLSNLDNPTQP